MARSAAAVAVAVVLVTGGCGGESPSLAAWCGMVARGAAVPLDAPDAPTRWSELENAAPDEVRGDVQRLRVAAQQVAGLESDDAESAARLVLTPLVLDAHHQVVTSIGLLCRIDVSTMSVVDLG